MTMTVIRASSPAKVNLGLEVTGRRPDGYHDLVSIFQTITLADAMEFEAPVAASALHVSSIGRPRPELQVGNLVTRALELIAAGTKASLPTRITLEKRIPVAAGLGGASSNAALTLRALTKLWNAAIPGEDLLKPAKLLGSDVPFFLTGVTALVTGTGDHVLPLPRLEDCWLVLLVPRLERPITRKTATLYAALTRRDFTSGDMVNEQTRRMARTGRVEPDLLVNPFQRHLKALRPEITPVLDAFRAAGAPFVAMSGAGPTHYTIVPVRSEAERIAARARSSLGDRAELIVATVCPAMPVLES